MCLKQKKTVWKRGRPPSHYGNSITFFVVLKPNKTIPFKWVPHHGEGDGFCGKGSTKIKYSIISLAKQILILVVISRHAPDMIITKMKW